MTLPFQRVLVVGGSGAGKSTLAIRLAEATGLPLTHLDQVFWQPGWKMAARGPWRETVARMVAADRWIIEGTFSSSLDLRLPRADLVVWFDVPRLTCVRRAFWRTVKSYGRVRGDMAPGCPERFDFDFYKYIWTFNSQQRPLIEAAIREHGSHLRPVVIMSDSDADSFLATVRPKT